MKKPKQTGSKTNVKAPGHSDVTDLLEKLHTQRAFNRSAEAVDAKRPSADATNQARLEPTQPHPAASDDAELRLFEAACRLEVRLPEDAHVVGEPVTLTNIRYLNLPRVGLVATCKRGKHTYEVNLADVTFAKGSPAAGFSARYRAWLGLDAAAEPAASQEPARAHPAIALDKPVELIVLACKSNALRCRELGTAREVTLRTAVADEVPGSIIAVTPAKQWTHARHPYLSGNVTATRVDVAALNLVPLALREYGEWDPQRDCWREEDDPIDELAERIIARGKRTMVEMEQLIPGADPDDFDSDAILEASELNAAGDRASSREILMNLLAQDLRCLDAHAHLGNFAFKHLPEQAQRHYQMGAAIGELSLHANFDGVLAWGLIDNRPYLRCLHGSGICAWRLGDDRTAAAIFERMLWLNPSDNQGARFNLAAVEAGKTWKEVEGDD